MVRGIDGRTGHARSRPRLPAVDPPRPPCRGYRPPRGGAGHGGLHAPRHPPRGPARHHRARGPGGGEQGLQRGPRPPAPAGGAP
ncbi:MAG: hypothetical protein COT28_16180 [Methylobacterium sp. CG08_land_8_20_14_0_20_71_15]|nr:hypothetical protein [Methylorubrum sp. DB1722]PIU05377.1 MAG: hypothetical protein COT56_15415 [Methylobacterium sp. CG09_land_8_20_14_0_10_71_15]PIU12160.1 MAG: hypothetical protein COT28_16180 [Methylobacterium sp. CG08_land_8_20_14_0_20_71_15]